MWTIFELNWNSYPPILTFLHLSSCIITFCALVTNHFLSLIWWNLLSLSMWLVPVLIVFGLWLNMLCLIWRCWGSLIKWRIIGRGYQRPTYHFRSPHYDHHHLLSCHDHNCYCLLLNNFLWNPRFLLNCAFQNFKSLVFLFSANIGLFNFPFFLCEPSTFGYFLLSSSISPLYKSFTFLCNLFWLNIVQQVLPVCASKHLNCWLSGQGDQRVSCTKMAFGL